jgi:hypothetical protein
VTLDARASKKDGRLVITYRLANPGPGAIYVRDLMVNYDAAGQRIDPDLAYVFWEQPATARIVRGELGLPPDIDVTKKESPFVRAIAAGEAAEGRISLAMPIPEYSPFYPPPRNPRLVPCGKIRLLIGWIEERPGMLPTPRKVGGEEALLLKGSWTGPIQRLAEKTIGLPVDLQAYTDGFDRSLPMR